MQEEMELVNKLMIAYCVALFALIAIVICALFVGVLVKLCG